MYKSINYYIENKLKNKLFKIKNTISRENSFKIDKLIILKYYPDFRVLP